MQLVWSDLASLKKSNAGIEKCIFLQSEIWRNGFRIVYEFSVIAFVVELNDVLSRHGISKESE